MPIHYQVLSDSLKIIGQTYPHRERIKALGARFDPSDKSWVLPLSEPNRCMVDELCRSVGGGQAGSETETQAVQSQKAPLLSFDLASSPPIEDAANQDPTLPETDDSVSVSQLMEQLHMSVARAFPSAVWIYGEVQNLQARASGIYFQLAEEKQGARSKSGTVSVNTNIWRGKYRALEARHSKEKLGQVLQDGLKVRLLCQVSLYKDRGQISLSVVDIDPNFTKGALALAREKLLRELRSKGLDRKNKALFLSDFPLRIGLISAEGSRAKSDFLDQLFSYGFPGEVIFYPAQMQGEATLKAVVEGLEALSRNQAVDVIVITRGGGSASDLRWFDAPEVAYAIAACQVPIVAAIGHHEDFCVAEEICYLRQKTPTAAADYFISHLEKTKQKIYELASSLAQKLSLKIARYESHSRQLEARLSLVSEQLLGAQRLRLSRAASQISQYLSQHLHRTDQVLGRWAEALYVNAGRRIGFWERRLLEAKPRLEGSATRLCAVEDSRLSKLELALKEHDPIPWMKLGWTQLLVGGTCVKSVRSVKTGDALVARLPDGVLDLRVTDAKLKETDG